MIAFCKLSVGRSKNCLEFSIARGRLPIFGGNLKFSDAERNQKNSYFRKTLNFN